MQCESVKPDYSTKNLLLSSCKFYNTKLTPMLVRANKRSFGVAAGQGQMDSLSFLNGIHDQLGADVCVRACV